LVTYALETISFLKVGCTAGPLLAVVPVDRSIAAAGRPLSLYDRRCLLAGPVREPLQQEFALFPAKVSGAVQLPAGEAIPLVRSAHMRR